MRAALIFALLGCSSTVSGQPDSQPQAPASVAPATKAAPMTAAPQTDGFAKAHAAFTAHAAQALGVGADQLTVVPQHEPLIAVFKVASGADQISPRINAAVGFQAAVSADRQRRARGWALPDGTVITPQQNLGALLTAAHLGQADAMPIAEVVRRLIWSMGAPHVPADEAPQVEARPDGSATIRFTSKMVIPGGPKRVSRFVIERAADGSAQLSGAQ